MEIPLDLPAAWSCLEAMIAPLGPEEVPLSAAAGRVLRAPVAVDRDRPPFDRAAMDGFAVRAAAVRGATRAAAVRLPVVGESAPGAPFVGDPQSGGAVRIMTGAPVPAGFDAVVPVEETSGFGAAMVAIFAAVEPGRNVTRRAAEGGAGDPLFAAGHRLRESDVGALAAVGVVRVVVGRRPRVAVLSTGNELVPPMQVPSAAQIRDSNGPMLEALAAPHAAEVRALGIAPDDPAALAAEVPRGLEYDLLLASGGVSMGAYDFVAEALAAHGVRVHFRRVALQPGKPTLFGTRARCVVLALPGNPVSVLTTFRLFALAALRRLEGESRVRPRWESVPARFAWERHHGNWLLLPGMRLGDGGAGGVERVPYAGSGDLLAYARADCQIVLGPDLTSVACGDPVPIWPL